MSNSKDIIITTNAKAISLKKGAGDNTLLNLSDSTTALGNGSFSVGNNTISIGCNGDANQVNTSTNTSSGNSDKLIIDTIRESGNYPNNIILFNPDSTPQEATYSSDISEHLLIVDDSLNVIEQSIISSETNFNIIDTSFNILDTSFNLNKTVIDASLNVHDTILNTLDVSYNDLYIATNTLEQSFQLNKSSVDVSLNIHDNSLNILDTSYNTLNNGQNTIDTTINNLITQRPLYGSTFYIGSGATAFGSNSFAIGSNASTGMNDNSVAIGSNSVGTTGNVVLGDSTTETIMNELYAHDLRIGDVGHGTDWSGIQHKDLTTPNNYAIMAKNDGRTLVNSSAGNHLGIRISNSEIIKIETDKVTFNKKILTPNQPVWYITNSSGGSDQWYGGGSRIGSIYYLGGQSLVRYFNSETVYNTTHYGWNSDNGTFTAHHGSGIYMIDLYVFCNNAQSFAGRISLQTNAGRNQGGQFHADVNRVSSNETCTLLRWTWYANAGNYFYVYTHSSTLTAYLAPTHTCYRITKIL